jgi:hypothetical protein
VLSKKWNSVGGDMDWHNVEMPESRKRDALSLPPVLVPEKKRTRNIGSKSKRLLIDSQDALELKLTWEEAQDLLRPPPEVKPSVVMIEDHLFEEYEVSLIFISSNIIYEIMSFKFSYTLTNDCMGELLRSSYNSDTKFEPKI